MLAAKLLELEPNPEQTTALLGIESDRDIPKLALAAPEAFLAANPLFCAKWMANDVFIVEAAESASPMVLDSLVFVPAHCARNEIARLVRILGLEDEVKTRGHIPVDHGTTGVRLHVQHTLATLESAVVRVPQGGAVHWSS